MSLKTTTSLQGETKVKDLHSHLSETPRSGPGNLPAHSSLRPRPSLPRALGGAGPGQVTALPGLRFGDLGLGDLDLHPSGPSRRPMIHR